MTAGQLPDSCEPGAEQLPAETASSQASGSSGSLGKLVRRESYLRAVTDNSNLLQGNKGRASEDTLKG